MINTSIISQVPLFATLPVSEVEALAISLEPSSYDAGTVLFAEGEHGDRFYIVLEGQIAIVKAMGTEDERLLGLRGSGEFVGEMSLLNRDGLRTASAQVHTDARVLELTRADFDAMLYRHPTLAYEMLRVMSMRLRASHEMSMQDLQEKNRRLAEAYANLQAAQAQLIEQEALARELRLARELQESMLPHTLPQLPGYDIGARMVAARMVGGDFFDVFTLGVDTLAVAIGDVSGKGVPAALFMTLICSLLRAEAFRAASPEEALRSVNRQLLVRNSKGMFVTVLYGVLHLPTRSFTFVRAGHDMPLIYDEAGALVPLKRGSGHPLGLFPSPALDTHTLTLPPRSTMLLYTDGATEAIDAQETLFGPARLQAELREHRAASAQALCERIIEALASYHGAAPQADDITLLALHTR
jgi:sigma-B regulation protein RsbU (phosphoserine phosphatase)